jgi:hypothetical protein
MLLEELSDQEDSVQYFDTELALLGQQIVNSKLYQTFDSTALLRSFRRFNLKLKKTAENLISEQLFHVQSCKEHFMTQLYYIIS